MKLLNQISNPISFTLKIKNTVKSFSYNIVNELNKSVVKANHIDPRYSLLTVISDLLNTLYKLDSTDKQTLLNNHAYIMNNVYLNIYELEHLFSQFNVSISIVKNQSRGNYVNGEYILTVYP